jgi:hypothetical protein
MRRRTVPLLLLLAAVGCSSSESATTLVPHNPFESGPAAAPSPQRASYSQAAIEVAARVDQLGHKIVMANPQIGQRPVFRTVGSPEPDLFHRGTSEVFITEGLVRRCASEGQLAAFLAYELGRMVAEREALASIKSRDPDREPPVEVRVGNDNAGAIGPPDLIRQAELARFEAQHPRRPNGTRPPLEPSILAKAYLQKAGYQQSDLDAVAALLPTLSGHGNLEKQLLAAPPAAH